MVVVCLDYAVRLAIVFEIVIMYRGESGGVG